MSDVRPGSVKFPDEHTVVIGCPHVEGDACRDCFRTAMLRAVACVRLKTTRLVMSNVTKAASEMVLGIPGLYRRLRTAPPAEPGPSDPAAPTNDANDDTP